MSAFTAIQQRLDLAMGKDFLTESLRKTENKPLVVTDYNITRKNDDGLLTWVVHVTAKTGTSDYHLVVKVLPDEGPFKETMKTCGAFQREIRVYADLLPFLAEHLVTGVKPITATVPQYYGGYFNQEQGEGAIALEDLCHVGFEMRSSRSKEFDFDHIQIIMRELAKFHAVSLFSIQRDENFFAENFSDMFNEGLYQGTNLRPMYENAVAWVTKVVDKHTDDEEFKSNVKKLFTDQPYDSAVKTYTKPPKPFGVICHGDCHVNNAMFRYSGEGSDRRPVDVKLYDWQWTHYGPPAHDLAHFVCLSTTKEMRKRHLVDLLMVYHATFTELSDRLNVTCPEFTFDVLMDTFKDMMMPSILFACFGVQASLASNKDLGKADAVKEYYENRLIGLLEDAIEIGATM